MGYLLDAPEPDLTVLLDLADELQRARSKHGPITSAHEGYAVILEEVDEYWTEVKAQTLNHEQAYKELIQVAAMAIRTATDAILR